jgi:hypothetical protein
VQHLTHTHTHTHTHSNGTTVETKDYMYCRGDNATDVWIDEGKSPPSPRDGGDRLPSVWMGQGAEVALVSTFKVGGIQLIDTMRVLPDGTLLEEIITFSDDPAVPSRVVPTHPSDLQRFTFNKQQDSTASRHTARIARSSSEQSTLRQHTRQRPGRATVEIAPGVMLPFVSDGDIFDINGTGGNDPEVVRQSCLQRSFVRSWDCRSLAHSHSPNQQRALLAALQSCICVQRLLPRHLKENSLSGPYTFSIVAHSLTHSSACPTHQPLTHSLTHSLAVPFH